MSTETITFREAAEATRSCEKCIAHLSAQPHLRGACASVGIEHGLSTQQMMLTYIYSYHERGHTE